VDARVFVGLFGRSHKAILGNAQDLWDAEQQLEAVGLLESVLPQLRPRTIATDALIVATLAVYSSDLGDPQKGLALMSQIPLDGTRLTDVHLICLASRCSCRAAAGDLEGARRDRDAIRAQNPHHPSLLLADAALR
jgi:hypothetical protein